MGFTAGLLGGVTLTTAIVYFSLSIHARNRSYQATLVNQQSHVLNGLVDRQTQAPPPPVNREVRTGLWEEAKDRWNRELESNMRKLYQTNWSGVRERAEETVGNALSRGLEKSREAVPDPSKR